MARGWTFRGDDELDPILEKWSKQSEKSFHVRQALRQYLSLGSNFISQSVDLSEQGVEPLEVEASFDEWG